MLACPGDPPDDDAWALEVKFDGMRAQVRFDGHKLCVRSRPGRDCTTEFPELEGIKGALAGRRVILDAELVCLDGDGKPDFEALRTRLRGTRDKRAAALARHRAPATLMIFDVLHLDGFATRDLPYAQRRELLAELALDGLSWKTPEHFVGRTADVTRATREQGLEGVSRSASARATRRAVEAPRGSNTSTAAERRW
jgi:bifunctional non-homologous end joining protein LigD